MAAIINVSADMRVGELMKLFNQTFEYLRLRLYTSEARLYIGHDNLTPYRVDVETTIADARVNNQSEGVISIEGTKSIKALEQELTEMAETEGTAVVQLLQTADGKMKKTLSWVFGEGNDFDKLLCGVNLLAVAGNKLYRISPSDGQVSGKDCFSTSEGKVGFFTYQGRLYI